MSNPYALYADDTLVLGNAWCERRWHARVGEPCRTIAFLNKRTQRDYLHPPAREFSLRVDGVALSADDSVVERVELRDGDPARAIVHLRAGELALELHALAYAQHPVIRKWLVIRNESTRTVTLDELDWEDVPLLVSTRASADVWSDYFTRRDKAALSSMDDCALLVHDTQHHEGFIVASEAPGPLKRMEVYAQGARVVVGFNRDEETIFARVLAPSETYQTPASFILPFANAIPQDVIDHEYGHFVAAQLTVCEVARVPSVMLNSWQPFEARIDRALLLDQIERAAALGVDAYQVDDGWFDCMGDWNDDWQKFPNGLVEIAEQCRARGMRFGLWLSVSTVDEQSRVAQEHPDWIARAPDGTPNCHNVARLPVMCLASAYYDFIRAKIDEVIARYGVELLKLDLSAVRNPYTPGRNHGCWATNHAHHAGNDSHLRIMERLFDLVRALRRRHPSCLFDVSYEMYGVIDGHDLALTQVADQNWFTNIASPNEINLRREVYQRGRVTRPWTLNFGGALLEHPNAPHYGLFATLTAHAMFWGDLTQLDEATRAHYRKWFTWLKAQRARDDFYRHYQVSDVFAVPEGAASRDYRHAIPAARYGIAPQGIHPPAFETGTSQLGDFWDGVARLNANGEGPIFLFRPAASVDERFQLRIPWVQREARYRVTNQTEERVVGVFDGATLIEHGIAVVIAQPLRAAVIVLERVAAD